MNVNSLNSQVYGSEDLEKKLVFVHGLLGAGQNWRSVAQAFSDHQVLTYDQRGHGRSPWSQSQDYHVESLALDLEQILELNNFKDAILVGHSLGARVVQNYASRHKCRGLVLVDMGPEPEPSSSNKTRLMLESIPTPFSSHLEMKEFFKHSPLEASLKAFLRMNLKQEGEIYNWKIDIQGAYKILSEGEKPRWDEFLKIKSPCLVIRGEKSEHLSPKTFAKMKTNPFVHGVVVEGAGHWVHHEQQKSFIKTLRSFADGLFSNSKL